MCYTSEHTSELRKLLANSWEAWYIEKASIKRFSQRARWQIGAEQRKTMFRDINSIVVFKTKTLPRWLLAMQTWMTGHGKFEWEKILHSCKNM